MHIEKKYYKNVYGINASKVGNLTVNNGVVSGFTNTQYLTLPEAFQPNTNSWNIVFKVKLSDASSNSIIIGNTSSGYFRLSVDSSILHLYLSTVSNSWNIGTVTAQTVLENNIDYWIKAEYIDSVYSIYLSTDGINYNLEGSLNSSSTPAYQNLTTVGCGNTSSTNQFRGTIDLKESYININGERWWDGMKIIGRNHVSENEDYDYYVNEVINDPLKAVILTERHYWKREQTEQSWTQPILTADGTIGDDSFAVLASAFKSGNETYKAFDNNTSTMWCPVDTSNPAGHYIIIYNPNALNVSNISVTNRQDTTNPTAVSAGIIYASNNNEEWIEISNFVGNTTAKATWNIDLSLNENYYKYYKFYISSGQYGSSSCGVAEIKLTATQLVETIVPGTAEDYDYYTDDDEHKANSSITKRHYWKNVYIPNGTITGSLTNNNGVVSGFSNSNYLLVDKYPTSITSLEMCFKVRATAWSSSLCAIVGQKSNNYKTPQLSYDTGVWWWGLASGSTWTRVNGGTPELNKDYWIKGIWDGSQIELLISEDGETFTSIGIQPCTVCTWTEGIRIGDDASSSDCWTGSIDFRESYINVNGERWWDGVNVTNRVPANTFIQPVLTENGIIGGNTFACTALNTDTRTAPYMTFDSNKANAFTAGWLSKAANNYFEWYNPKALNISKLDIQYMTSNSSAVGYLTSWTIQASNDGETFVDILSGTDGNFGLTIINIQHSGYYKYWRLLPLTWSDEWYCIVNMDITATTEGEDYDYYTDEQYYSLIGDATTPHVKPQTVFENSIAGIYDVTIPVDGNYELIAVGGGGGGASSSKSDGNGNGASGGSGGYSKQALYLLEGIYTVCVGAGGARDKQYQATTATAKDGEDSYVSLNDKILFSAGGGKGGQANYNSNIRIGGAGGEGNVQNGNVGGTCRGYNTSSSGGASVYGGYGKGGNALGTNPGGSMQGRTTAGDAGYVRIFYLGDY